MVELNQKWRGHRSIAGTACAIAVLSTAACGSSHDGPAARGTSGPTSSTAPTSGAPGGTAVMRVRTALAPWRLPRPVSRAVAFADGSRIVLAGGLIPGDKSIGDVTSFDPTTGSHQAMPGLRQPSHDAAGITLAGTSYLVGGGDTSGLAVVQQIGASATTGMVGSLPEPRSDLAAAVVGGAAYVLGGYTGSSLPPQVLVTRDGRHFRAHGSLAVPVRYAGVTTLGHSIYLFGGLDAGGAPISDVQRYDTRTGRTRIVGHLPDPLSAASAVTLAGHVYVAGGRLAGGAATGGVLAWSHGRLHRVARLRHPVANAAAVVRGSTAWLLGGEAASDLSTVQTLGVTGGRPSQGAQ